ncbi:MAG: ABC transporter permease [Acetobacter malorum]
MITSIFRSVLRQTRRHPLYVGLNIFGLVLGIGVFLTLTLLVRYEYSFNAGFTDADRLARMDERWSMPGTTPYESADVSFRAVPFLKQDFPEIEEVVTFTKTNLYVQKNGQFTHFAGQTTDPAFFRMFSLRFLHGNPDTALTRPDGLVLSQRTAMTLFGKYDVLGKTVEINRSGQKTIQVVTGILATLPSPGLLDDVDMLLPVTPQERLTRSCFRFWGSSCGEILLKFRRPEDIASVNARLPDFVNNRAAGPADDDVSLGPAPTKTYTLSLVPILKMHFHDVNVEDTDNSVEQYVIDSIGLIGLLALILGCANAVNLATARAGLRAREVALRKTLGAPRHVLFGQFMGEAMVVSLVAGLCGLAFCEAFTPAIASMTGEAIRVDYGFIGLLLPLVIISSGLASGVYPALVLSGYQPAAILAATRMPAGGRRAALLRNGLVVGQFSIAICIVICTLVIDRQTSFMRNADRGYVRSGLLIGQQMHSQDIGLQRRMMNTLRAIPGVTSVTLGELEPNPHSLTRTTFLHEGSKGRIKVQMLRDRVSSDYRDTYQPHLLAGRWFDTAHGQDDGPSNEEFKNGNGNWNVIINSKAARAFGFEKADDAVGKILRTDAKHFTIIGVIEDIRFSSPRESISPEILFFSSLQRIAFDNPVPAVRFSGVTRTLMAERLDRAWRMLLPDVASHFAPADELMETYYSGDERRGRLFTLGAVAALLIACLGLYGLAAFAAARRVHEIGIRKTLGATAGQTLVLLLQDFLKPVFVACLLACPVSWLLMRQWLNGFDERIALSPALFLLAIGGAALIATCTVLGQTLHLARAEPARALRAE